ncbi:MAG TPA: polysaccharide deacetylase family protein [Planctomycetota bacterium]|nr:polysaccharide deacetylase family protein [Planctomycetota bacterium]HRR78853.1 polysaccharide deacetylase family protein [Planctomycetota bacterium]HRT92841.1 polysaccharide deacetylase family protein [Planctomycetota bacterium]
MRLCVAVGGLDSARSAAAAYTLHTLLDTLGLAHDILPEAAAAAPPGRVALTYGRPVAADALVEIPPGEPTTADEAVRVHRRAMADRETLFAGDGARVRVEADIVGAAAFWLTGGDEARPDRDAFSRLRGAGGPLPVPAVTDLMHVLGAALERAAGAAGLALERQPAWPAGHRFAVLLSHDVDLWRRRTARRLARDLARSLVAPRRLPAVARAFCGGPDPWSDLDAIADLEQARGMHSTFFVLAGRPDRRLHGKRIVNSYDAPADAVRDTLRRLVARGCEVALHGSFDSFAIAEQLAAERRDLEALCDEPVRGCRQHFLRFHWPDTWRAQAAAGLRYDATLGYHDADGYRAGFSFPFRPILGPEPPAGSRPAGGLLELPLAVSDGAFSDYGRLDASAAWERLRAHLERTEADGSMLGVLWHNTHFCDLDAPGYRGVYERALDWIRDHGGWGASAIEIAEWWKRRLGGDG